MKFSIAFLLALNACSGLVSAQDIGDTSLGTTNEGQIQSFWQAIQTSNGPVTVLAFGDSVSADYLSVQKQLFWRLQDHFGSSGLAFSIAYSELGGGAAWTQPNSNWWASHASVPAGGDLITYSRTCDRVGLFWVAQPSGGGLAVSVSTNGGLTRTQVLSLNGYATSPTGCYTNCQVPRGTYSLRIDGLSGTNAVLGVQLVDAAAKGICVGFMAEAGQSLGAILAVSTNILYPILSGLNPQLVVWHMKEVGDPGSELVLSDRLLGLECLWRNSVTHGDVVYLGTPYDSSGSAERQNPVVRDAAIRDHRAYIDCMTPCVSFEQMVARRLLRDETHPNDLGNSFLANTVVWPQLGLARLESRQPLTNAVLPANPFWLPAGSSTLPVYGWAASTPEEATVVLYNPIWSTGSALLDCQTALAFPAGTPAIFDLRAAYSPSRCPLTAIDTGQPALVTLNPGETVVLEAHPRPAYSAQVLAAGPLAYWRLGESNGPLAADVLGANPGQYVQAAQHVRPGALAQQDDGAVELAGAGSHVLIPNGGPFDFTGSDSFTLSVWVRAAALGGVQRFFSNRDCTTTSSGTGYAFGISGTGALLFTAFSSGEVVATNLPAVAGLWYHLAVVRRLKTIELYWNGACVGGGSLDAILPSSTSLQLGGSPAPCPVEEAFAGQLDEAAVFAFPLSASQIQALYQSQCLPVYPPVILTELIPQSRYEGSEVLFSATVFGTPPLNFQWLHEGQVLPGQTQNPLLLTNLTAAAAGNYRLSVTNAAGAVTSAPAVLTVLAPPPYVANLLAARPGSYWRLDEEAGPTLCDCWGTNHGTATGNVAFQQFGALPYTRQYCTSFDGSTGTLIEVPYSPGLNPPAFSIEFWVQPATYASGAQSPLASRDLSPASGYGFQITPDQRWSFQLGLGGAAWQTNLGPAIVPGKWAFLSGTFDGTNQSFYVDGELVAQATAHLLVNTRRPLRLGAGATESGGGDYFAGKLDEVVLLSRALTATEVLQHYQSALQAPHTTRFSIESMGPNLMLLWPTGQLEHADLPTGPWLQIPGATSPWLVAPSGAGHYYRLAPH